MIRIRNLQLTYRSAKTEHAAVRNVSLDIEQGQFFTLLGPSGCGKTSILRCVAGLEHPDSGEIVINEQLVFSSEQAIAVPPNERNIGMVFQSYAIWPHMTVFDNVAFPLRHARPRLGKADIRKRTLSALEQVQLGGMEERPAPFLSGGQQQRLALARAIVGEPSILLLDEPLSNLDAKLREEMRLELRDLIKRLGMTTLFVTHEQVEALTMSDVVAVMNAGCIVQSGAPLQIYARPDEQFVANFVGKINFLDVRSIAAAGDDKDKIETPIGALTCRSFISRDTSDVYVVAIRPENIALARGKAPRAEENTFAGEVTAVVNLGNVVECQVNVAGVAMRVQLHPSATPSRGDHVTLRLPIEHCLVLRQGAVRGMTMTQPNSCSGRTS